MRTHANLCFVLLLAVCAYAREPKLGLEEASKKAIEAAGGGRVERAELEQEGDKLLWTFDVRLGSDALTQVWLDADTGKLARLDAETASQRETYARATRKELEELEKRIEALKREAGPRTEEARKVIERRAGDLEKRVREAQKELAELEASSRARWRRFKSSLDRALVELRKGYDEAVSTGTVVTSPPDAKP